ncbi:MAG TPA: hypothetical protein VFH56_14350 [Acidimicrobiales bacterium]|nr:hypothetical protein [Acidimicrobiales bacterium]
MSEERTAEKDLDHDARVRGVSISQYRLAADFTDAILRDVFQGKRDHLRGQMLDVAAKVSRRHPWPYFEECVEAEVQKRVADLAAKVEALAEERERIAQAIESMSVRGPDNRFQHASSVRASAARIARTAAQTLEDK